MAILTATIRLAFGMARDDQLPVLEDDGEGQPQAPHADLELRLIGVLSAVPFIQFSPDRIAVGATATIYLSYLLGNLAVSRAGAGGRRRKRRSHSGSGARS